MLVIEKECPNCFGNLVLDVEERSVTCEDCDYTDMTKDKRTFALTCELAVEYGPKESRPELTELGNLILNNADLLIHLRDKLQEAIKGLDLEDHNLSQLRRWNLIEKKEERDGENV